MNYKIQLIDLITKKSPIPRDILEWMIETINLSSGDSNISL